MCFLYSLLYSMFSCSNLPQNTEADLASRRQTAKSKPLLTFNVGEYKGKMLSYLVLGHPEKLDTECKNTKSWKTLTYKSLVSNISMFKPHYPSSQKTLFPFPSLQVASSTPHLPMDTRAQFSCSSMPPAAIPAPSTGSGHLHLGEPPTWGLSVRFKPHITKRRHGSYKKYRAG